MLFPCELGIQKIWKANLIWKRIWCGFGLNSTYTWSVITLAMIIPMILVMMMVILTEWWRVLSDRLSRSLPCRRLLPPTSGWCNIGRCTVSDTPSSTHHYIQRTGWNCTLHCSFSLDYAALLTHSPQMRTTITSVSAIQHLDPPMISHSAIGLDFTLQLYNIWN